MDGELESSLKIANIESLMEVKKEERIEEPTIKIRTISEINGGHSPVTKQVLVSKQHPQQLKQIVVRKIPSQGSSIKDSRKRLVNGTAKPIPGAPIKPSYNSAIPPAIELYIKQLEDHNNEMKKALLECRREAVAIQTRTNRLTNFINATLGKCHSKRPVMPFRHQTVQSGSQQQLTPINQLKSPLLQQRNQLKLVPEKVNNVTGKGNVVCRVPVFPIKTMQILKQLEIDLSKKEFSEYVFQKLYTANNKSDINKPTVLLNQTLNSIISTQLMEHFQYDDNSEECESFKALVPRVRVLYGKLVNALSNTIFGRSVDMVALEKFVKIKISNHRNEYLANAEKPKRVKLTLVEEDENDGNDILPLADACFRFDYYDHLPTLHE